MPINNSIDALVELSKLLSSGFKDKDKLAQALVNPNSHFIPLGDIMDVSYYRAISQGNRVALQKSVKFALISVFFLTLKRNCSFYNYVGLRALLMK
jgi:hypothetical protein